MSRSPQSRKVVRAGGRAVSTQVTTHSLLVQEVFCREYGAALYFEDQPHEICDGVGMGRTAFIFSEAGFEHKTPRGHPESPERLAAMTPSVEPIANASNACPVDPVSRARCTDQIGSIAPGSAASIPSSMAPLIARRMTAASGVRLMTFATGLDTAEAIPAF